jgi:hypothetical protein
MIEITVPKTLKKFGYGFDKPEPLRRTALIRAKDILGSDSILFNMSSSLLLTKQTKEQKKYDTISADLKWLLKKGNIKI